MLCSKSATGVTAPRWAASAVVSLVLALSACTSTGTRNVNDTAVPGLQLTLTGSAETTSGLQTVAPGTTSVALKVPGGSAVFTATNPGGVSWIEIWMTTVEDCGGTIAGPGLAARPAKRVDATLTATSAPNKLAAGVDINLIATKKGCTYTYDVWGKAANAATTPVQVQTPHVKLVMPT